jgi:hypothetical protein
MPETCVIDGALMTVRTARSRHRCTGPYPGDHWIEPGEQYEDWRVPPWSGGNESPTWWRGKRHVGAGDHRVCDEIEAYREKAVREQRALLTAAGLLKAGVSTDE